MKTIFRGRSGRRPAPGPPGSAEIAMDADTARQTANIEIRFITLLRQEKTLVRVRRPLSAAIADLRRSDSTRALALPHVARVAGRRRGG